MALTLDRSPWVRLALYLFFVTWVGVMVLKVAAYTYFASNPVMGGLFGVVVAATAVAILNMNYEAASLRNGRLVLVLGGLAGHMAMVRAISLMVDAMTDDPTGTQSQMKFLLIPFALTPMVHAVLLGRGIGIFSTMYAALLGSLVLPEGDATLYMAVSLVCGLVAVQAVHKVRKRVQLLRAGVYSGLAALLLCVAFKRIDLMPEMNDQFEGLKQAGLSSLAALGMGIVIALLVSGLLPVLEGAFHLTTDISWLELSDLNHKLLRRLQLEAPGTFHHSLVVASLSEAAAEAVGANAAMCRVSAYFHDIGKLSKPEYFIENQVEGVDNPHDSLTPTMSALIIIAHVKDGVDLAVKHKLNPRVIDVIQEHHGDSLVSYFHRRAQEQKKAELEKVEKGLENPEDLPKIDEKNFRYPGPRPRTRESGIVSLADIVESASRSLRKPTPAKIRTMVEDLVDNRVCDGQLSDCILTLRDLAIVKDSFCATLRSMLHTRIDYPKDDERSALGRKSSDMEKRQNGTKTQPLKTAPIQPATPAVTPRQSPS
ncbi:HDIG domain-containing metalloprotein [Luteolibacter sp. Populi]|uniref:HDIG domain-containing metalloprotein n=1 Tax=Luteolibacter sp. Populi TaxID=3230487 RepID=UPI003465C211